MLRPRLHDMRTASREDLLDQIAAQEHYISWLLEGISSANTLLRSQANDIAKMRQQPKPPADAFTGLGEWESLFGRVFGEKK